MRNPSKEKKIRAMLAYGFKRWAVAKECDITEEEVKRYLEPQRRKRAKKKPRKKPKKKPIKVRDRAAEERAKAIKELRKEGFDEDAIRAAFGT